MGYEWDMNGIWIDSGTLIFLLFTLIILATRQKMWVWHLRGDEISWLSVRSDQAEWSLMVPGYPPYPQKLVPVYPIWCWNFHLFFFDPWDDWDDDVYGRNMFMILHDNYSEITTSIIGYGVFLWIIAQKKPVCVCIIQMVSVLAEIPHGTIRPGARVLPPWAVFDPADAAEFRGIPIASCDIIPNVFHQHILYQHISVIYQHISVIYQHQQSSTYINIYQSYIKINMYQS